jgi:TolB-like protein/tetratricopeptide (TPR) repeat protein
MSRSSSLGPLEALRSGLSDRYDLERELGAGGMAVVYLARDLQHDRLVALKVLRADLGVESGVERFHREIRLAARLVHPHILPLLDSGQAGGRLWYTMPFIEGESLRARLEREKQLPVDEAVRLTREIAEALTYAHANGILHRDIKPDNILLSNGHALVADFGIARALGGDGGERITGTGIALGTPGYMSPEQSSGDHQLDARSDLYALASVCYEMLVGEPPFTGPTAQAVIARRLSQPPPSIRTTRSSVPEAVDAAVRRALAPVPADRFAGAAEFSRALSAPQKRPRTRWAVAAGAAVLVVAAAAYWYASRPVLSPAGTSGDEGIRLAVLPFRLIGRDTTAQYLADGITGEVSSTLANLSGLRVVAQTSVAPFAGSARSMREIGTALGADALVEGEVQRVGNDVRVRVRLIDAATEESKWSQQYHHTTQDVFLIQSEVASKVAAVLRIQLAERESQSLRRPPTTNPEAYDYFLRGSAIGPPSTQSEAVLDSAISNLTRAVTLDSLFAAAWALRASHLASSVFLHETDPRRLDQAEGDIRRALALDSSLAIAWSARADLYWNAVRGWHFPQSLTDLRHAIALQPSHVRARQSLASLYFHYGFLKEAEEELAASLSLDPRDGCDNPTRCIGFSRPRVARVLWYRQQFDSALALLETFPYLGGWLWEKAVVLNGVGRPEDGLALLDSARTPGIPEGADREAARGLLYAALGRPSEAQAHLDAVAASPGSRSHFHHAQFTIACAYARLGKRAEAVEWLRQAAENGMPNYPLFRNDPNLRQLQGDPAYEALMTRLKQQFEAYGRLVQAR